MSLLDKLRERFESADLSKYTDFKVLLQYNIQQDGGVAAVFAHDLSNGRFIEGNVNNADATFTLEFSDYVALHRNTVTMATLMEQGKLKVEGNVDLIKTMDAKRLEA